METSAWANARWRDLAHIRALLRAGTDPDVVIFGHQRPLDLAVRQGTPEVVAELAKHVNDVDAVHQGKTALWQAVFDDHPAKARALTEAGADPWRPVLSGWSPGRLSLAGPYPDLFAPARAELSEAETAAVTEASRLIQVLGGIDYYGFSLACVAEIGAAEAAERLEATISDIAVELDEYMNDPDVLVVGATDVPGGCVIVQPWAYGASMPGVTKALSRGTVCYAMYANPKSGNQGRIARDGVIEGWDLHPGGEARLDASADEVLLAYLYQHQAPAFCFAYAGLRPADARALTGPADLWLELPDRDYWH